MRDASRRQALRRRSVPRRRAALPVLIPFALLGAFAVFLMVIAAVGAALAAVAMVAFVVGPVLVAGGLAFAIARHGRRRRLARRTEALTARPDWPGARARFAALASDYAAYECDPVAVLHRPALSDVRVPSTARFVDAFSHAQALDTDARPGDQHAASYVAAVDAAERAWRAAREAADRIRLSGLSADERASVERVIKLLTVARDSGHEAERLAAYARARSELARLDAAGVVHVPGVATAALDRAARGALPA